MSVWNNVHEDMPNIDELSDLEYETVKMKFFEIFGRDKDPHEIEVIKTDCRNGNRIIVHCQFQNNTFVVRI